MATSSGNKERHIVLEQERLKKIEEIIASEEAEKRSQKYLEHATKTEESTKQEIERAKLQMQQRNVEIQFVKDEEKNFEKHVLDTYKAKSKHEAEKCQKWDEERQLEDIEMEEKIKIRNEMLKKKLIEMDIERENAEIEARNIEESKIAASKAFQERNIQEIGINKMLEKELQKKEERMLRNEMVIRKKDEADRVRTELEINALAIQKEIRAEVLELQQSELNRFEKEIHEGQGIREREKDKKAIVSQITKNQSGFDDIDRQKERDKEKKTEEIVKETEKFVAMQANKRKALQNDRKQVEDKVKQHYDNLMYEEDLKRVSEKKRIQKEKQQREEETKKQDVELLNLMVSQKQKRADALPYDYDNSDEERLRVEALQKRKQQQQEIMNQHDKELELLTGTKRDDKKVEGKKKGFFSSLFGKR